MQWKDKSAFPAQDDWISSLRALPEPPGIRRRHIRFPCWYRIGTSYYCGAGKEHPFCWYALPLGYIPVIPLDQKGVSCFCRNHCQSRLECIRRLPGQNRWCRWAPREWCRHLPLQWYIQAQIQCQEHRHQKQSLRHVRNIL